MNEIIEIGTAKANPGTIAEGKMIVETLAGGGDIAIPVTIMNGINDGPCFWINVFINTKVKIAIREST